MTSSPIARTLGTGDLTVFRQILAVFAEAFQDGATYLSKQPTDEYLYKLLASDSFVAIAGYSGESVVGGLAGYVLRKFEQERSEFYIYDLAVLAAHRRQGVATAMIENLKKVAAQRSVHVIYVQADYGDEAAISLYTKLGVREDVMHFDIPLHPSAA
ncbi:MAG TPA: AAC(3)-I family aminoglycoside N-acetyltransferase [Burkholderiales bacterium]|nr:AAC(3)-I family aminoglycoside N-acetyltransferase [Burkholderiales bacterium]